MVAMTETFPYIAMSKHASVGREWDRVQDINIDPFYDNASDSLA